MLVNSGIAELVISFLRTPIIWANNIGSCCAGTYRVVNSRWNGPNDSDVRGV
jgi:hypothetical protein